MKDSKSEELYLAIANNDMEAFEELLDEGVDINEPRTHYNGIFVKNIMRNLDNENVYPLEIACRTNPEMAKILLERGAKADVVDEYLESTPLIYAMATIKPERFELANLLIEQGADINHVDHNGRTPLNLCTKVFDDEDESVRGQSMDLLKYMLDNCDIERVIRESGNNPLCVAAEYNNLEAIKYIVANKYMDINETSHGCTPLVRAVLSQEEESCELLLELGADKSIATDEGKTAYDYALEKGNEAIIEMLK